MTAKFERAFLFTLANEKSAKGGDSDFVNDPNDPGGPTKWGVTIGTLSAWRGKECTAEDVQSVTLEETKAIYLEWYWERLSCELLPEPVGMAVFDAGVLYGTVISAKLAQETANALLQPGREGIRVDGILGPLSGAVIASCDPEAFLVHFCQNILARINALVEKKPRFLEYRLGWEKRAKKLLTLVQLQAGPQT